MSDSPAPPPTEPLAGFDLQLPRCWWPDGLDPGTVDPLMVRYHDDEWGVPVGDDDDALFERLALESFQAGLSWSTILHKRDAFRAAFSDFSPTLVARFGDADRARLLGDASIVRNRAKIDATIGNAVALLEIVRAFGSSWAYFASWTPQPPPPRPAADTWAEVPSTTPASDALSADMRGRGFRFVGSTIVYSFLQSVGLVDDHLAVCWRHRDRGSTHRSRATAPDA